MSLFTTGRASMGVLLAVTLASCWPEGSAGPTRRGQAGLADAGTAATVGVYRSSDSTFHLKSRDPSTPDLELTFGVPGDKPVAGDFDGDGVDTIGVYRDGAFYLRNSNTTGFADGVLPFGLSGDKPLVLKWKTGDSEPQPPVPCQLGVYRDGVFSLIRVDGQGPVNTFAFGLPGDLPLAGDWNGDGVDTVGVFRPSNGFLYLRNSNDSGYADVELPVDAGLPAAGDWNGDGRDTVVMYSTPPGALPVFHDALGDIPYGIDGDVPLRGRWTP